MALVIAILLERYFYSPDNSIRLTLDVQIEFRNLPPTVMVVDPLHAEKGMLAQVEVRGPGPLVHQLQLENSHFTVYFPVDLPQVFTAPLKEDQLNIPSGVEVLSLSPPNVTLRTEPVVVKELIILPEQVGSPADGFQVSNVSVFPSSVMVRGPRSKIEGMRAVRTDPLDISNVSESLRKEVLLAERDPLVSLGVTMVVVDLKVSPVLVEKTYDNVGVTVLAPGGFAASVEPSRVSVQAKVPVQLIESLTPDDFHLTADAREYSSGSFRLSLSGEMPKNVSLEKTIPDRVKVHLVSKDGGKDGSAKTGQ